MQERKGLVREVVGDPWIHKVFLKDTGKLRPLERYWHFFDEAETSSVLDTRNATLGVLNQNDSNDDRYCCTFVLPDSISVRKYLKLFQFLLSLSPSALSSSSSSTSSSLQPQTITKSNYLKWFLLESVVEYMDYRNQALVLQFSDVNTGKSTVLQSEIAAPQERSTLQKLVRQGMMLPFCDLSVRQLQQHEDEWHWLNYESLSVEERSRHGLLRAARLLQEKEEEAQRNVAKQANRYHTQNQKVVILVDEETNQKSHKQEGADGGGEWNGVQLEDGIRVESVETFVQFLAASMEKKNKSEQLLHLLQSCKDEYQKRNAPKLLIGTPSPTGDRQHDLVHWSEDRVAEGLRKGTLLRGRLNFTKENPREAFVRADGKHWFVDASSAGHHNRAMHQDIVVLRPLPENEWGRPIGRRRLVHVTDDNDDPNNDSAVVGGSNAVPTFPSARVVAIASMARRTFVATMVDPPMPDESAVLLVPMDIRIPKIRLPTKMWQKLVGKRLLVTVDSWEVGSNYPHGHVSEILGDIGDVETEIQALLCENEIRLDPFSLAAQACLPPEGTRWCVPDVELERRRDLRQTHRIFSVDPVGCQDIDDAMHAQYLVNGDVEIGVHIADVTWFVPLDSALDREARIRGTTFYLVDRRFDMLPALLSSNLCSLHGETDRLAVSVIWTLSSDLKTIKSTWYGRTIIHNVAAMTYEQAANILEGKRPENEGDPLPPPLTAGSPVDQKLIPLLREDLGLLTKLARMRRKHREEVGGAVDLSSGDIGGELKFTLVNGKPVSVKPKQDMEIHHTIAELMIWANTSVASKIYEAFPGSALLRIHRDVEEDRFDDLREMLSAGNLKLEGRSNMELAEALKKAENNTIPVVASLFRSLATRAMSEAQYVSTGDRREGQNLSHYGLGLSVYTHFTSPIRRYADVVVHHQLMAAILDKEPTSVNDSSVKEQPLPDLPDSTVISMLATENENPCIDNITQSVSKVADPRTTSNAGDDSVDAANYDIDELVGDATDLVIGERDGSVDRDVMETDEDLEIDALIRGAADSVELSQDPSVDADVDMLVGGAADLVVNSAQEDEDGVNIEIDDLIGGAADVLFIDNQTGAGIGDADLEIDGITAGADAHLIEEDEHEMFLTNAEIDDLAAGGNEMNPVSGEGSDGKAVEKPRKAASEKIRNTSTTEPFSSKNNGSGLVNSTTQSLPPFLGNQVSTICERLNLHNRLAKQSSFECQSLFLSLFFKDHVEVTEAVVLNLKENGFVAYVPRFDLRAPVYLRDADGFVQMDPALLGLPKDAGDNATLGFAWSENCRRFPLDEMGLDLTPGEKLEVKLRGSPRLTIKTLDVVSVEIFCSDWDQRARIPSPRLIMINRHRKIVPKRASGVHPDPLPPPKKDKNNQPRPRPMSLFDIVEQAVQSPKDLCMVPNPPKKGTGTTRVESLRGRMVFGEFINPDTRQARQLQAQQEAAFEAAHRRNMAIQQASRSRENEDSTTQRIERDVTTRQQKLAKEKRESRRAKKNKN